MVNINALLAKDLQHVWHPCSQMKDFESCPPLVVERAQGSYIYTNQGPLIDAISSWWCKSLGHGHPEVIGAIKKQLECFEHVIAANTTHPTLVELAETLSKITAKQHVFFASDGSSAVEIAMKLAIQAMQIKGHSHKRDFIALKNAYHGETLGALTISDLGIYKAPFPSLTVNCHFIDPLPYVDNTDHALWTNCDSHWQQILPQLERVKDTSCAIIIEPIIQGSAGMHCYSADFLKKLALWAKQQDIYLIADEIMTGIGRTGTWLACDHAQIDADMVCLSKGLTSGTLPLSCVMLDHSLFELFYGDYDSGKSFLHSHTYSANPLAISAALATIKTIEQEQVLHHAKQLATVMQTQMQQIASLSGKLSNIRGIGAVVAADLVAVPGKRIGQAVYQQALQHGALIRPIGNTLYWLPPLNTDFDTIGKLADITLHSIEEAYNCR